MTNSTIQTISASEMQNQDAPVLVAMVYHSDFDSISAGLSKDAGVIVDDGGFSRIAMLLVLSFISVVTISRRSSES